MKKLPFVIFVFIMLCALCSSVCSYKSVEKGITRDVNNALKLTLAEMPTDVINADTIRCYRSHLTIAELKNTASIALSDQRASGALLFAGLLWMMCSLWYMRRFKPEMFAEALSYGGIVFANDKFITAKGEPIHFTPMQHCLMEMFMMTESHSLSKQEICDRLWPKKPNASDTLYTLIKRVKPILEAYSNLKIESDRGRSYALKLK